MKNTDSNEHCTESTFRGKTKLPKEMDKNLIKIKEFSSLKTSFCITSIICLIITLIAVCISISVIRKDLNELKNDFSGDNETVSTLKENYDDIFEQLSELSSQIDSERLLNEKALNKIEKKILEREELISEVQDELNQLKLEIENIKTNKNDNPEEGNKNTPNDIALNISKFEEKLVGLEKAISEEEAKIENNKQNIENHSTEKAETTKRINKLEKKMEKFSEEMTIRKEEIEEIQESIKSIESEEELDKELSDGETDEDEDSEKKEEGMSSSPILNGLHYYEFRETNSVIKTLYSNLTNIQNLQFDSQFTPSNYLLSANKTLITKGNGGNYESSAFINTQLQINQIYLIEFLILRRTDCLHIGVSRKKDLNFQDQIFSDSAGVGLDLKCAYLRHFEKDNIIRNYSERFEKNDILTMEFDRIGGKLTYFKNGIQQNHPFHSQEFLEGDFYPAIWIRSENDSVQILRIIKLEN